MEEPPRRWRTSRIFLALLWIVMLVASVSLVTSFISAFFTNSMQQFLVSLDWSGYVVVSDSTNAQPVFTSVSGSWIVPTVKTSMNDAYSAAWIGIGGELDSTLIQIGTDHDSANGLADYSAWYELLPENSIVIDTINVSPGDKITASISLVDSATDKWSIKIRDLTRGQTWENNVSYASSRLSAEWIVERPTIGNSLAPLADFGEVTFTNASVRTTTTSGAISDFPFSQIVMQNRQNTQLVTVSSLSSGGSSFTISYLGTTGAAQGLLTGSLGDEAQNSRSMLFFVNELRSDKQISLSLLFGCFSEGLWLSRRRGLRLHSSKHQEP